MFAKIKRLLTRSAETAETPDSYELTYPQCASFLIERMGADEVPFHRSEWHLALVEIPSDWDPLFDVACSMNALVVFVSEVSSCHGEQAAIGVADALAALLGRAPETGPKVVRLFSAMLFAETIATDHPVLQREDTRDWKNHLLMFGRAKAAIELMAIEERHRNEAISRLGRCLIYATHCSSTRFHAAVAKMRFLDGDSVSSEKVD